MSPSDFQDIQHGYSFVLTAEEIGQYDVKYVGRQKVDEIDCYVFDVSPKVIEKKQRYLLGRIWVDATDLQIVVTNGRMVPDDTRKGSEDLHPPFMTWRQQVDGALLVPGLHQGRRHPALQPAATATWPRTCTSARPSSTPTTSSSARRRRSLMRART